MFGVVYGLHVLGDKLQRHNVLQLAVLMGTHDIAVQVASRACPWLRAALLACLLHALHQQQQQNDTALCAAQSAAAGGHFCQPWQGRHGLGNSGRPQDLQPQCLRSQLQAQGGQPLCSRLGWACVAKLAYMCLYKHVHSLAAHGLALHAACCMLLALQHIGPGL